MAAGPDPATRVGSGAFHRAFAARDRAGVSSRGPFGPVEPPGSPCGPPPRRACPPKSGVRRRVAASGFLHELGGAAGPSLQRPSVFLRLSLRSGVWPNGGKLGLSVQDGLTARLSWPSVWPWLSPFRTLTVWR